MSREIITTSQFRKDLRKCVRQGYDESDLRAVVRSLANDETLEARYHDHALTGNYAGARECHVRPDWLLIYRKTETVLTLVLVRTGSHSELLGK